MVGGGGEQRRVRRREALRMADEEGICTATTGWPDRANKSRKYLEYSRQTLSNEVNQFPIRPLP